MTVLQFSCRSSCRGYWLHENSEDDPTTNQQVTIEKDGRLPGCNVSLRHVKLDLSPVPSDGRDQRLRLLRGIADLNSRAERFPWCCAGQPVDIPRNQLTRTQFLLRADDQGIRNRILPQNVERHRRGNAQSLALTDRVVRQ